MKAKAIFIISLMLLISCAFAAPSIYKTVMKFIYPVADEEIIYKCATENELDPYLVLSVIKAESNFVSDALSHKDAKGLMQITDETGKWAAEKMGIEDFEVMDLNTPSINVSIGCWYLRDLLDKYDNNITLALCAYNAGSTNVSKWLANKKYSLDGKTLDEIPFNETKKYVENIEKYHKRYMQLYEDII